MKPYKSLFEKIFRSRRNPDTLKHDTYLSEMSNLRTDDTGLSTGTIYVSAKEGNHGARVKFYRGRPGKDKPSASISH